MSSICDVTGSIMSIVNRGSISRMKLTILMQRTAEDAAIVPVFIMALARGLRPEARAAWPEVLRSWRRVNTRQAYLVRYPQQHATMPRNIEVGNLRVQRPRLARPNVRYFLAAFHADLAEIEPK